MLTTAEFAAVIDFPSFHETDQTDEIDGIFFLPVFPQGLSIFQRSNLEINPAVQLLHEYHLYWPERDVDLEIDSLESPEKYSLKYKTTKSHSTSQSSGSATKRVSR